MERNRPYTIIEIAQMMKLKERRARDIVRQLEMNGDIRKEGKGRAMRYFLKSSSHNGGEY